jgi:cytidylate kinase
VPSTRPFESREKRRENKADALVISVCGLAGSGKSTVARKLAAKYHLKHFSGGDVLKALALKEGVRPARSDNGWWESKEGLLFLKTRSNNQRYDKRVDRELLEIAERGNVVLDSWTMPWLLQKGFKIWLEASAEKRAERIAQRDKISMPEALQALKEKESYTKMIYRRLYGFRLGEDFEPFHFILDTDTLSANEVFQVLCLVIDKTVLPFAGS